MKLGKYRVFADDYRYGKRVYVSGPRVDPHKYWYSVTNAMEFIHDRMCRTKHGKGKLSEKVRIIMVKYPRLTSTQVAKRIINTSSDAVRQTLAWRERLVY